jgi:hypothetical protein
MATKREKSPSKRKTDATRNAQQRAQRQKHLPEAPEMPRSHRAISQARAGNETPLSGADRPVGARGNKVNRPMPPGGTAGERTPINEGEQRLRRVRGIRGDNRR